MNNISRWSVGPRTLCDRFTKVTRIMRGRQAKKKPQSVLLALEELETRTVPTSNATISIVTYSGTYDGLPHSLSGTATGDNGEDLSGLLSFAQETDAGNYSAGWFFRGNADYNSASGTANVSIAKADATITITPVNGTYDGSAQALGGTAIGVLSEDLSSYLTLGSETEAGHYGTEQWSFAGNIDYNGTSGTSSIDIAQALLSLTAVGVDKVYDGTTVAAATLTLTGVIGSDDVTTSDTGDTFATKDVGSGKTITLGTITLTGAKASDYTLSNPATTTTASVTAAPLTVTADNLNMEVGGDTGDAVPSLTYQVTGLVDSESATDVLTGVLATEATSSSSAGSYGITQGSLAAGSNYSLTFTPGTLTANALVALDYTTDINDDLSATTINVLTGDIAANSPSETLTVSSANGSSSSLGTTIQGTYGTLQIGADGTSTYTLDLTNANTIALDPTGPIVTDHFSYTIGTGLGATATADDTYQINPARVRAQVSFAPITYTQGQGARIAVTLTTPRPNQAITLNLVRGNTTTAVSYYLAATGGQSQSGSRTTNNNRTVTIYVDVDALAPGTLLTFTGTGTGYLPARTSDSFTVVAAP